MGMYSNAYNDYDFLDESSFPCITNNYLNSLSDVYLRLTECDRICFESTIELDFLEAYNESGAICLTEEQIEAINEAEKNGFWEGVKSFFKKVRDFIVRLFADFVTKLQELFNNDKGLIKRLQPYVTWDKVKTCPLMGDTVKVDVLKKQSDEIISSALDNNADMGTNMQFSVKELDKAESEFLSAVNGMETKSGNFSTTEDKLKKYKEKIDAVVKALGLEDSKKFMIDNRTGEQNTIANKLGETGVNDLYKTVVSGYRVELAAVKTSKDKSIVELNKIEQDYNKSLENSKGELSDAAKKKIKLHSDFCSLTGKYISTEFSFLTNVYKHAAKISRNNFVTLGMWAYKKEHGGKVPENSESKTNEAAQFAILDIENDLYTEAVLGL